VRKPVLGKGLAALLHGGSGKRAEGPAVAPFPGNGENAVGPGLKRLFRGDPSSSNGQATAEQPSVVGRPGVSLKWVLLGADLLLMMLVCLLVANTPRPLRFPEWALCFLAFGLGAAMAILALTQSFRADAPKQGVPADEAAPKKINGHINGELSRAGSRPNDSAVDQS
jgi:hypothetical protein